MPGRAQPRCGYPNNSNTGVCRRPVPRFGMRCRDHPRTEAENVPGWRDWSNIDAERESDRRLMTDGGEEDDVDLSEFEEGNEVRVTYRSQRSGNEVERKGEVSAVIKDADDGPILRVHSEERNPIKHTLLALMNAPSKDGEVRVHAWSLTIEPDSIGWEDGPEIGRRYSFGFEVARSTYLGPVRDVKRTSHSGNYLIADGGERETDKVGTFSGHVSLPASELEAVKGMFEDAGYRVEVKDAGWNSPNDEYLLIREPEPVTDGGRDIPEMSRACRTYSGPGDDLRRCPECDAINNLFVNEVRCWDCGFRWGSGGEVIEDDDDGAEIIPDGGVSEGMRVTGSDKELLSDPSEERECGICGGTTSRSAPAEYFRWRSRMVIMERWRCQQCETGGNLLRRRSDGEVVRLGHVHTGEGFEYPEE